MNFSKDKLVFRQLPKNPWCAERIVELRCGKTRNRQMTRVFFSATMTMRERRGTDRIPRAQQKTTSTKGCFLHNATQRFGHDDSRMRKNAIRIGERGGRGGKRKRKDGEMKRKKQQETKAHNDGRCLVWFAGDVCGKGGSGNYQSAGWRKMRLLSTCCSWAAGLPLLGSKDGGRQDHRIAKTLCAASTSTRLASAVCGTATRTEVPLPPCSAPQVSNLEL
ncbi:uncharacterized protein BCR38DRAFT_410879 [Pseudomassariella vexata]|uniref:Uncharacterized protein n=1 Tax=Pseudomassariella vexata TaxID=1141098 RepID=A0A1Y2DT74_9PEZI|nr:uncharacterized protein BCR38DRAFT_410879 [Pseudomassariella vexata]ORY62470.1 hypothetical protein BCR38DRAFT_410879 [Pseudomassariella vexata]